jgi:hypothetical protein
MLVPIALELELILQIRFIQSYQNLQQILFTKNLVFYDVTPYSLVESY